MWVWSARPFPVAAPSLPVPCDASVWWLWERRHAGTGPSCLPCSPPLLSHLRIGPLPPPAPPPPPQEHVVVLVHSKFSGKKTIFLDGKSEFREAKVSRATTQPTLPFPHFPPPARALSPHRRGTSASSSIRFKLGTTSCPSSLTARWAMTLTVRVPASPVSHLSVCVYVCCALSSPCDLCNCAPVVCGPVRAAVWLL